MSEKQTYIQSELLMACCEAQGWPYREALDSFEGFYQENKRNRSSGLREAVKEWYEIRKKGAIF